MMPFISGENKKNYQLLDLRLRAFTCLVNNVDNTLHYQVILDRALELNENAEKKPPYPYLRPTDFWSRQELMTVARQEMDNALELAKILSENEDVLLIDHTDNKEKEYQRLLGPDIVKNLNRKVEIMSKYWVDYKTIFAN